MSDRCTGHCCRAFIVLAIHELGGLDSFRANSAAVAAQYAGTPDANVPATVRDMMAVGDMLIPIGEVTVDPLTGRDCPRQQAYTCRHLTEAGDCGVYATRPDMCRGYPYDASACHTPGCTASCRARAVGDNA